MNKKLRDAFTLIEVMIAVVIISVVIMALLEMRGNSSFIFSKITKDAEVNQYASFFLSNQTYGFTKESVKLDDLLKDFNVDDELRRELKALKVDIVYQKLERFGSFDEGVGEDMNTTTDSTNPQEGSATLALEIGKTILKLKSTTQKDAIGSTSLIRMRIQ